MLVDNQNVYMEVVWFIPLKFRLCSVDDIIVVLSECLLHKMNNPKTVVYMLRFE